jgi:mRNA interferase ChpB
VLFNKDFNLSGRALVAPITQGGNFERVAGWAVTLMGSGTATQGAVVVSQCRVLDMAAQGAKRIEPVSADVLDKCLAKLESMTAR